jgi:hypothetical protein
MQKGERKAVVSTAAVAGRKEEEKEKTFPHLRYSSALKKAARLARFAVSRKVCSLYKLRLNRRRFKC